MTNDHLTFKTGDTCVSINKHDGKYGSIIILGDFNEDHQNWSYSMKFNPEKIISRKIAKNLKGKIFMSKNDFDFYYTNEKHHIKEAEKIRTKVIKENKIKETKRRLKEEEFFKKLKTLLSEYSVEIGATQTEGDTHGVEVDVDYYFNHK